MDDRKFYQEDSPWVEMKNLSWEMLTEGRSSKQFSKGLIFYNQQEFCENVFIIKRGRVAMCICTPDGGLRMTVILDQGCMFGNQTLFDDNPNSCQAKVISDKADIYVLSKDLVRKKLKSDYELAYNMLVQSNRVNRVLLTQIELMSFRRSESRVCFYLLHMTEQYSTEQGTQKCLQLRFTHQDIADVTGLSRVCVSNIISNLVKEKILIKTSGIYQVVQIDGLKRRIKYYEPEGPEPGRKQR